MKILQINCVYKKGSTGKITYDLHQGYQSRGLDSVVVYGRGDRVKEKNVYHVSSELYSKLNNLWSRFSGIMYGGCGFSTRRIISIIKKEKPDIVHIQCINGYFVNIYKLITWLKNNNIHTVLTLHAEFMYTANCGYALDCERWKTGCGKCPRRKRETLSFLLDNTARSFSRMQEAFEGFEKLTVVSVSPWLMERAKQSLILKDKHHVVIYNGVNTDVFHGYNTVELRKKMHLQKRSIVFHATPYFSTDKNHLKGGGYIYELARAMPDVTFVVAGRYKENFKNPGNIVLLGMVKDQEELARYYSLADVTILVSKKETFSMVVAESLCCGTPVVGFKAGGPEQIAIPEYSSFVDYGDTATLKKEIYKTLDAHLKEKDGSIEREAFERYSNDTMVNTYISCYQDLSDSTDGAGIN